MRAEVFDLQNTNDHQEDKDAKKVDYLKNILCATGI
jgi:hypothetical protein